VTPDATLISLICWWGYGAAMFGLGCWWMKDRVPTIEEPRNAQSNPLRLDDHA
jgi:hypothetical protein